MAHVGFTKLRDNMKAYFNEVLAGSEPLFVTRQGGKGTVVVMSETTYLAWQDALLRSSGREKMARVPVRVSG